MSGTILLKQQHITSSNCMKPGPLGQSDAPSDLYSGDHGFDHQSGHRAEKFLTP